MKRVYALIVIIISFMFIPSRVSASFCDYTELARLKNIASNINMSYNYSEKNEDAIFNITFSNFKEGIKMIDATNNLTYRYDVNKQFEFTLDGYNDGKTYRFDIYAENTECESAKLLSLYANLPFYNKYYVNPICDEIESYNLCQKWYQHGLSNEEFIKRVKDYKTSLTIKHNENKTNTSQYIYISDFLAKYYYYFLLTIIIGGIYSISRLTKKDDFDLKTE